MELQASLLARPFLMISTRCCASLQRSQQSSPRSELLERIEYDVVIVFLAFDDQPSFQAPEAFSFNSSSFHQPIILSSLLATGAAVNSPSLPCPCVTHTPGTTASTFAIELSKRHKWHKIGHAFLETLLCAEISSIPSSRARGDRRNEYSVHNHIYLSTLRPSEDCICPGETYTLRQFPSWLLLFKWKSILFPIYMGCPKAVTGEAHDISCSRDPAVNGHMYISEQDDKKRERPKKGMWGKSAIRSSSPIPNANKKSDVWLLVCPPSHVQQGPRLYL